MAVEAGFEWVLDSERGNTEKGLRAAIDKIDCPYGYASVWLSVNCSDIKGVQELQKLELIRTDFTLHLKFTYDHLSKGVEECCEWLKQNLTGKNILVCLNQCYDCSLNLSVQLNRLDNHLITFIEEFKAHEAQHSFRNQLLNLSSTYSSEQQLEQHVLSSAIKFVISNQGRLHPPYIQVFNLGLKVLSLTDALRTEWEELGNTIETLSCKTFHGSLSILQHIVLKEDEWHWIKDVFLKFTSFSIDFVKDQKLSDFSKSIIRMKVYMNKFHGVTIKLPQEDGETWVNAENIADLIEDLKEQYDLAQLTFVLKSPDIMHQLIPPLHQLLQSKLVNVHSLYFLQSKLVNVHSLYFIDDSEDPHDWPSTKEAKALKALLAKREARRLDFLIRTKHGEYYNRAKLMILGAGAAGKTSLWRSLLGKPFNPVHNSTEVADAGLNVTMTSNNVNIKGWKELHSGQELLYGDFIDMGRKVKAPNYTEPFDHDIYSYENPEPVSKLVRNTEPLPVSPKLLTVPTTTTTKSAWWNIFKTNKSKSEAAPVEGSVPAIDLTETDGIRLSIWDFGGQKVFDVLHHLYLTNAGLILLVVNLVLFLTDPELAIAELKGWFKSLCVYTKAVRIFIVGTRARDDKMDNASLSEINDTIQDIIFDHDAVKVIKHKTEDKTWNFFPVDNSLGRKNEVYLAPLRKAIANEVEPKYYDDLPNPVPTQQCVPLAWMLFIQIIHRDMGNIAALEEIFEKAKSMGFQYEETEALIDFFSKSGVLVSFHERFKDLAQGSDGITDDVVLKPEWLLSSLASFIYDEALHKTDFQTVAEKQNMGKLFKAYRKSGILAEALLVGVLQQKGLKPREIKFIKNVCESMLIMSKLSVVPDSLGLAPRHIKASGGFWFLPSMNKLETLEDDMKVGANATEGQIKWLDIVPKGLFERCVCALLDQRPEDMKLEAISHDAARMKYKTRKLEMRMVSDQKYRILFDSNSSVLLREVRLMLEKVTERINSIGFALELTSTIEFADDLINTEVQPVVAQTSETKGFKWDCFLSHTWTESGEESCGTHKKVVEIAEMLRKEGLKVWVDDVEMRGATDNCMIEGLDNSAVCLVFITKSYLEKAKGLDNNSRKEFIYASNRGVEFMIPVLLNGTLWKAEDWGGPVGFHFGKALYYDFSSQEKMEQNLAGLCKAIQELVDKRQMM